MPNGTAIYQSVIVGSGAAPHSAPLAEMNLSDRAEVQSSWGATEQEQEMALRPERRAKRGGNWGGVK